jgi:hypothetical protein
MLSSLLHDAREAQYIPWLDRGKEWASPCLLMCNSVMISTPFPLRTSVGRMLVELVALAALVELAALFFDHTRVLTVSK